MYAIIAGGGAVARALADRLIRSNCDLAFIIEDRRTAEEIADSYPASLVIQGAPGSDSAMRDARAASADVLFAVSDDDTHNIVNSLMAKERYSINDVVALASTCADVPAFAALGIGSVCLPAVVADLLAASVASS